MISEKAAEYQLFWMRKEKGLCRVGVFLVKKWVDKVIDISRVSDRMIDINVLFQGTIISVISTYAPQCGLDNSKKDDFCHQAPVIGL